MVEKTSDTPGQSETKRGLFGRRHVVIPWDRNKPYFVGRAPFIALVLLNIVGAFAAAFLTYRHVMLSANAGKVGESFLCKAQGIINCDGILLTDYSVILGYFPSSVLGFMGFAFALWIIVGALFLQRLRKLAIMALVLYFFTAIGFSWYYIYIMIFEVDYICTWCIVCHVVNFTSLFIALTIAIKRRKDFLLEETAPAAERFYYVAGACLIALLVFAGSGFWEYALSFQNAKMRYEELANDPIVIMALLKSSPTYEIPIGPGDPVYGNPAAPFPVVLFSDFQCPMCSQTEAYLKEAVRHNPDVLRLVYKNFPLSPDCNRTVIGNLHPYACEAAKAAHAAFVLQGNDGFWKYGDLLFANQKTFKRRPWIEYATQLGMDVHAFEQLLGPDQKPALKIKEDTELGASLKLYATPQLFFEGKNIPQTFKGDFLLDTLEELIRLNHPEKGELRLNKRF